MDAKFSILSALVITPRVPLFKKSIGLALFLGSEKTSFKLGTDIKSGSSKRLREIFVALEFEGSLSTR